MSRELVKGFNHVATVTHDLDRLIDFYSSVFDVEVVMDLVAPGLESRHVGLEFGDGAFLHVWEMPEDMTGPIPTRMFARGRLDHLAIAARDEEALEILRERLVRAGACDGKVTDFGAILSVWFSDPDGMELEVCCMKRGTTWDDVVDPIVAPAHA